MASQLIDGPLPFLEQARALPALRRELDSLAVELTPEVQAAGGDAPARSSELHSIPNRLIVQIGHVGLSFSWLGAGHGTVAEGRLLVIEWEGLVPRAKGVSVLKAAKAVREQSYRPEATAPDSWRWRAEKPDGEAHSTAQLAAQWLAGAAVAAQQWDDKAEELQTAQK